VFPIDVDHRLSLEDFVQRGAFDIVDPDIDTIRFDREPINKVVHQQVRLIDMNGGATTYEVLERLDELRVRPVSFVELLAFGEKYPEKQREVLVVSLDFMWFQGGGDMYVPYLWRKDGKRTLSLIWAEHWCERARFAVIAK
jgi:hypothetical protein